MRDAQRPLTTDLRPGVATALLAALFATCALIGATPPARADGDPPQQPLSRLPMADVVIETRKASHRFHAWIATSEAAHEQGLMYVKALAPDRGMLFLFERPQLQSFWMKNTLIPLDLLFIAQDGRIIRIAENAKPLSLDTIESMGAALGVLEVAGGTSARLGLKPGDRVLHAAFGGHGR
jgi:uncharacterized protein